MYPKFCNPIHIYIYLHSTSILNKTAEFRKTEKVTVSIITVLAELKLSRIDLKCYMKTFQLGCTCNLIIRWLLGCMQM